MKRTQKLVTWSIVILVVLVVLLMLMSNLRRSSRVVLPDTSTSEGDSAEQTSGGSAIQVVEVTPETVQAADEKTASTPKIMPKAIGEDVKAVLGRWRDVSAMCDPVMRNMLDQCRPVPDDDRLVLQFTDPLNEEYFTQKEGDALEQLKRIIGSLIQKEVVILTRTVDAQTDAMYPDVMELIQFDGIEIQ